jgi:acetyl-CoA carboxylase carboxyltransferase component
VPRICLLLRKAYGGAYIVMDCKSMGNDVCLAWPSAEVAVMGAKGAVQILHRNIDDAQRAALEADYEREHLTPYTAAERGFVDAVIDPADTRAVLSRALDMLSTKRERLIPRVHSNTPL